LAGISPPTKNNATLCPLCLRGEEFGSVTGRSIVFPEANNPTPRVEELVRKSNLFLLCIALSLVLFCLMLVHASFRKEAETKWIREKSEIVQKLGLSDLCLFTEASYTRHLSQADRHTPFQDSPMVLEHFPSGAIAGPPPGLRKINGKVD
jgi:hypothetical protein